MIVINFVLVLHDIIGTMFNKRFIDELFKPQELFSKKAIRTVFDRLAHASIMRLNSASMDKVSTITANSLLTAGNGSIIIIMYFYSASIQ